MSKSDRLYDLLAIFRSRRYPINIHDISEQLECSEPTAKRYIAKLRHEYGAPIRYDMKHNGYILDKLTEENVQLPGLWFNISELHSLLVIQELIDQLEPGLLKAELTPFRERLERILTSRNIGTKELFRRIRFIGVGVRVCCPEFFKVAVRAIMERRRLRIRYHSRGKDQESKRTVSSQRLLYYRANWFLSVYCHTRKGLRLLALDRIREAQLTKEPCSDVADNELDSNLIESFGIFAGQPENTATLRFSPDRARWVADEIWHPRQKSRWTDDGYYLLDIPYSDTRELILEILKYGPDVEVLSPPSLRRQIRQRLIEALQQYD